MEEIHLYTNWDDVICPICLEFPHNSVLLQCTSYDNGCRPLVCGTDHLQSNCLYRFKQASGMSSGSKSPSSVETRQFLDSESDVKPACPLCRGEVTGWIVIDTARVNLDDKKRHCEEEKCAFSGTYLELQKHARLEHPHAFPSKIDPARQLDWENFQQSSEIIDVLSTIQSEIPRGVVLGDYVIEYGNDNSGDDFDDFPGDKGNWWKSCMLYQVFDNFRASRNRRRSRVGVSRRGNNHFSFDTSNSDEGSISSIEYPDFRPPVDTVDVFVSAREVSRGRVDQNRPITSPSIFVLLLGYHISHVLSTALKDVALGSTTYRMELILGMECELMLANLASPGEKLCSIADFGASGFKS